MIAGAGAALRVPLPRERAGLLLGHPTHRLVLLQRSHLLDGLFHGRLIA